MAKNKKPKFLISIHAPREGGDHYLPEVLDRGSYFNPRPPRGGRLLQYNDPEESQEISIHAPREGGDYLRSGGWPRSLYFNPRPPRGGRPEKIILDRGLVGISIHAPREGGDLVIHDDSPFIM